MLDQLAGAMLIWTGDTVRTGQRAVCYWWIREMYGSVGSSVTGLLTSHSTWPGGRPAACHPTIPARCLINHE